MSQDSATAHILCGSPERPLTPEDSIAWQWVQFQFSHLIVWLNNKSLQKQPDKPIFWVLLPVFWSWIQNNSLCNDDELLNKIVFFPMDFVIKIVNNIFQIKLQTYGLSLPDGMN